MASVTGKSAMFNGRMVPVPQRIGEQEEYKLTVAEMETVVNFSRAEKTLSYYTTDPTYVRHIDGLLAEHADEIRVKQHDKYGYEVIVPRSWFRPPAPPRKYDLTDEQRAAIGERLRHGRE